MPSKANSAQVGLDRPETRIRHYRCACWLGSDLKSVIVENGELTERALATAAWAKPADIAARRYKTGDLWLGRAADAEESPVGHDDDRHVLLVAGSRAGKGTSAIVPNICQWPGSIMVIDPKGENATIAATRRGLGSDHCDGLDQNVYVLDPYKAAQVPAELRATFNPLDFIDPDHDEAADEASRLADALVIIENPSDVFWDVQARLLIKGLILYVLVAPHFERSRSLVTVRRLLMNGDTELLADVAQGMENPPSPFEVLFNAMKATPDVHGIIAGVGETFANMLESSGKTFTGILAVAGNHTDFIDSQPMKRCLAATTPGFSLAKLKTDPMGISVFLSLPQRFMNTHSRWLRMMVSLTITEMEKTPGQPRSGHRVLMVLDEFAGLKRLEVIENAAAQIAGFGVKLFTIVQTLTQLKAIYRDNWEVFIANAGTRTFFSIEDQFTRDYVSKYLGETEVVRTTRNVSRTQGTNSSETAGTSKSRTQGSSSSTSSSSSYTSGSSSGSSSNFGSSTSHDIGLFWNTAKSHTTNSGGGFTSGSSSSSTTGSSTSYSSNQSDTAGESYSESRGRSESDTAGSSQAIHKRPLLTPDEIGQMFSRVDQLQNPAYPGLALSIVSGGLPMIVRRTNYFADPHFIRCFEPHPDYPHIAVAPVLPAEEFPEEPALPMLTAPPTDIPTDADAIIAYHGQEAFDHAISIHKKLKYKEFVLSQNHQSDIRFAKDLLGALEFALERMKGYESSRLSVSDLIQSEDRLIQLISNRTPIESFKEMPFYLGSNRTMELLKLEDRLDSGNASAFDFLKYRFFLKPLESVMGVIVLPVAAAFLRKQISLYILNANNAYLINHVTALRISTFIVVGAVVWLVHYQKNNYIFSNISFSIYCLSMIFIVDRFI